MKSNIRNSILPTAALCGLAIAAGIVTGALTAGFGRILLWIGTFRSNHLLWCLPFLPIAGVLMVWVYQKYGKESAQGMSLIFDAADGKAKRIPLRLIPLLIGSTWLTHLCGGSADGKALRFSWVLRSPTTWAGASPGSGISPMPSPF